MTTLPQTTSTTLRLPRVPSGQMAQLPHQSLGHGAMAQPAPFQMTGADVWRVIRSNIWLILISVLAFAIGGYFLNRYLAQNHPRYTATGVIQVTPYYYFDPKNPVPQLPDQNTLLIEQRTQAQMITQPALFSTLLRDSARVRETEWYRSFETTEERKKDLEDTIRVSPIPDSKLITISMTTQRPEDASLIVEELVNLHINNERARTQVENERRGSALQRMRRDLELKRNQILTELHEKQVELNLYGMGIPGGLSPKDMELMEMTKQKLQLQADLGVAQSQFEQTQQTLAAGQEPPLVDEMIRQDQMIMLYRQQIDAVDLEIGTLTGSMEADNPRITALQRRKQHLQQKLEDHRAEVRASAKTRLLDQLRAAVSAAQVQLETVNGRIEELKAEMGQLKDAQLRYLKLVEEEKELSERMRELEAQLVQVSEMQRQNELTGVSWMTRPETPDLMSFPRLPITMSLAVFAGLALSVGLAFLRELLDTSVRSPRDIARVGQINLLGMINDEASDPQAQGVSLPLVIAQAPHSMMAEQFRQLRTRLHHAASLDTTRSILVTSPSPEDGKTTVAVNLAAGLALNGRRILLVDANFRRPAIHSIFRLSNEQGFSEALQNQDAIAQLVQETDIPNLSVLAAGPKPPNPTELLESQLLIDFIERCLDEYDHVIFDSGPLLFVSDTVALAPRVDGVVSVIRARSNSRGVLQRMRDDLRKLRAEHLGVVLNAVRAQAGGYYNRNIKTYYEYSMPKGS